MQYITRMKMISSAEQRGCVFRVRLSTVKKLHSSAQFKVVEHAQTTITTTHIFNVHQ
jgi:hypothetical protein